ncbi:cell wall integrity protein scw1 [Melampsora americana]|nr:cell wall integrity protein scw1 [Melampsora americana]
MSILLSSDQFDKSPKSSSDPIDHPTNRSIFSSNLTSHPSDLSNLIHHPSSSMKNEKALGSQSIPEVEESAGSLLDSSSISITQTHPQSNSTSLRDFQSDPLLGPRRSSTYSNRDDPKPSSPFSLSNSAFSSFSFKAVKTTSTNLNANQIFYSSANNTPSPTTKQTDSPRLSTNTVPSTKSHNTSTEPFDLDQHNSTSTLHPDARSYSSPGTSTSLSTTHQSSREADRSPDGSTLQASQSAPTSRQEESLTLQSKSSWPLTASSTGPLDYCPGRDDVPDPNGWLYARPGQSGTKDEPIPPNGIPRSLSLQEIPSIPWLGRDRTAQSFGPPASGSLPGAQESLYTEPLLGRRMSLKCDMNSSPSKLKNLGSYSTSNNFNSHVYNEQARDLRVALHSSNDPSSFQQRLHAFIPSNSIMRSISPTNRMGRTEQVTEEISTIFVVGFPEDMDEREFQNMFIFSPGFEAATLKVPAAALAARDHGISPAGPHGSNILPSISQGNAAQQYGSTASNLMDPFWMPNDYDGLEDLYSPLGIGGAGIGAFGNRRQIIGFAKFKTRADALHARDVLSGRRVDAEKGCILKAELAKKNLHTKRGLSNEASAPIAVSTPTFPFTGAYFNPFSPSGDPFSPNSKSNNANSEIGFPSVPHRTKDPSRSSIDSDHQLQMNHFFEVEHRTLSNSMEPCQTDMSATRPRSSSTFDPFLITATNSLNLVNDSTRGKSLLDSFHSPTAQRAPIDYSAFAATPNPHHFTNLSGYGGRLARAGSLGCATNPLNTSSTWTPGPATNTINLSAEKVSERSSTTERGGPFAPTFFPVVPDGSSGGGSSQSSDSSSTGSRPSLGSSPSGLGSTLPPNSAPNSLSTGNLLPPNSTTSVSQNSLNRTHYPADQNPAINTLYVGNLPTVIPGTADIILIHHNPILSIPNPSTSVSGIELEDRLRKLFGKAEGFKRFSFRSKAGQPMCFVEFVSVEAAKKAMANLYGDRLDGLVPGGIRLAFSRNALGVRSNQPNNLNQPPQSVTRNMNASVILPPLSTSSSNPSHPNLIIPFTNHNLNFNPTHPLVASSSTSLTTSSS